MAMYRYGERTPKVAEGACVSDSALVIGDMQIADDGYTGHGVVLRGDYGTIHLGPGTAVEENAVVHIGPGSISKIGARVTIGHGATVHARRIDNFALIGMGAVVIFDAEIGEWAVVAQGYVVPNGMRIPAGELVVGVPATIVGDVSEKSKHYWRYGKQLYVDLAHEYPHTLEKIGEWC